MRADLTCERSSSDSVRRGEEWRKDEKGERKEEEGEFIADIIHSWPHSKLYCPHVLTRQAKQAVLSSIVVSISACHAEDPGSIPGWGV